MTRSNLFLFLSFTLSALLFWWGIELGNEAADITDELISRSAPEDILGLGYWFIWLILLISQLVIFVFIFTAQKQTSKIIYSLLVLCAVAFATASIFSNKNYELLETRVLG